MRGRYVRGARMRIAADASLDFEPVTVHGNRHDLRPREADRVARARITRFFEPDRVAWREEHPPRECDGLLRTAHDHDLIGVASYGAERG